MTTHSSLTYMITLILLHVTGSASPCTNPPAMDTIFSYLAASIIALLLFIKLIILNKKKNKNLPPSPLSLPIIGHLHLFKKPLHSTLARLSSIHGPILLLRFGTRPVLIVSSASLAEECFSKNDITFANRPCLPSAKHLSYNYTAIGAASYGPHWRNVRRIATVEVLSSHRLNSLSDVRAAEVRAAVKQLFKDSSPHHEGFTRVEMKSRLFGLSLNVIMMSIAGKRYYGEEVKRTEEVRRFHELTGESAMLGGASNVEDFLPLLKWVKFGGAEKKLKRLMDRREVFLQALIDESRREGEGNEGEENKKTMIGALLALQRSDPDYYTDQIIKGLIVAFLSAGTSTSSDTMEWAMSLLLNNPSKLKKAQAEIDLKVGNKHLVNESDLSNLPYLQCIISETLRMYPVAPLLLPHYSSEECVVGGYNIPKNTMLLVNIYSIQRDPKMWVDPTKFMPERFEGGRVEDGKMMPFGMGRRRCPGDVLAMRVMEVTLGCLIQCFEWRRVAEDEVDMREGFGLTLPKVVPLEAMYRPRQAMMDVLSRL